MPSTTYETVKFSCAIRGHHVYRNVWQPKENETLQFDHESDKDYNLFAIKTCRDAEVHPQILDHLPLEIYRFTKFLLDRGATITATLSSTHYRRSPLVQGGLEIPCVVNAKLIGTKKNKEILAKYLEMVQTHYTEPSSDEDVIMDSFGAMSVNENANTANHKDCTKRPNKEGKNKSMINVTIPNPKPSSDNQNFFKRTEYQREQVTPEKEGNVPNNDIK